VRFPCTHKQEGRVVSSLELGSAIDTQTDTVYRANRNIFGPRVNRKLLEGS
jgi:hypothetical protein